MKRIKNQSEFKEIIQDGRPILLDFYADWCGPCQVQLPVVEELSREYAEDFIIAKVNVDENPQLAQDFGVRSIPALFFIQDGEVKEKYAGLQSKTLLEEKINNYLVKT